MSESKLPAIGTRAVHKDDHAKQTGPVWEVSKINPADSHPVILKPAKHKLNTDIPEVYRRSVSGDDFSDNYVQL